MAQLRGVTNFVGMMYGYPHVVPAIQKFNESRVLGLATFKESVEDMHYWWCKEFMPWLLDPLTKNVTVSTTTCKLKELRQLQGIYTHVYHPDLPINDSQRMSCMLCGQSAVWYTGFTADNRIEFQVFSDHVDGTGVVHTNARAFTTGNRTLCPIATLLSYFF